MDNKGKWQEQLQLKQIKMINRYSRAIANTSIVDDIFTWFVS